MDVSLIIDASTKIAGTAVSLITLILIWRKAIPFLEEIRHQTNSLADKATAGARALGVQEGLQQAADIDPTVAAATAVVLRVAAERAKDVLEAARIESVVKSPPPQ